MTHKNDRLMDELLHILAINQPHQQQQVLFIIPLCADLQRC